MYIIVDVNVEGLCFAGELIQFYSRMIIIGGSPCMEVSEN